MSDASEPATLGTRGAVARRGDYLRAVLAQPDQVSVEIPAQGACRELPGDGRVRIEVSVRHTACDTLGPISLLTYEGMQSATLEVWLWRANAGCSSAEVSSSASEVVSLYGAPGSYALMVGGVSVGTLALGPKTQGGCGATGPAACDCPCAKGSGCVYQFRQDFRCGAACQLTCDNALGCVSGVLGVSCSDDSVCAPGLACREGRCRWNIQLGQAERKPCVTHTDCATGLACVEGDDSKRGCEVPCNAPNMRCPGAHYCDRDSYYAGAHWVCEWGGE